MEDGSNTMKGGSQKVMGHKRKREREKKTKYTTLIVIG